MFYCKKDLFYRISVVFMLLRGQVAVAQDTLKTHTLKGTECLNLLNKQYEVVKSYPMTGRQFQGKIILKF